MSRLDLSTLAPDPGTVCFVPGGAEYKIRVVDGIALQKILAIQDATLEAEKVTLTLAAVGYLVPDAPPAEIAAAPFAPLAFILAAAQNGIAAVQAELAARDPAGNGAAGTASPPVPATPSGTSSPG